MSWLDTVPTCSKVFTYQAALVCEDCAAKIIARLQKQGVDDDGDSETFPQGPYSDGGGEADSAQFCDRGRACENAILVAEKQKVSVPLANPLTRDGVASVRRLMRDYLLSPKKFFRRVGRLLGHVWSDHLGGHTEITPFPPLKAEKIPQLVKLVSSYVQGHSSPHTSLDQQFFQDDSHAYFVLRRMPDDIVDLLRAAVDDEGNFTELKVTYVPGAAEKDFNVAKLLEEARDEGAWD